MLSASISNIRAEGRSFGPAVAACPKGMTMAKQSKDPSYPKHLLLLALLLPSAGAIASVSDTASAQLMPQVQQQEHLRVRRTATRIHPPERTNTKAEATAVALPNPAIDKTSALGQPLALCNQDAAVQETFTLPGLKGEVTLDRCYKGRAHLICVFTALGKEAQSLTDTYTKIVDAKYPDLNSVDDGICKLNPETLASHSVGSEDFAKRFKELKSQYEVAINCAGNVEQAFKDATLTEMTQPPEIIKSMAASVDSDIAKTSEVHKQVSDLAEKMELSKKAMKTVTKIHHALCTNEKAAAQSSAEHGVENR
jgi:hypothetical protein